MVPKQFNVLSVEDSENDRLLLQRAFRHLSCLRLTSCVSDGAEAISYLEGSGEYSDRLKYPFPDLVILDIKMPVMNGFELLKWMKHQCWGKKPVVVLLTSSALTEDIDEGSALGAELYLVKPVTKDGLIEMLKDVEVFMLKSKAAFPIVPRG
jgi:CheY-like chemotaxis protein